MSANDFRLSKGKKEPFIFPDDYQKTRPQDMVVGNTRDIWAALQEMGYTPGMNLNLKRKANIVRDIARFMNKLKSIEIGENYADCTEFQENFEAWAMKQPKYSSDW